MAKCILNCNLLTKNNYYLTALVYNIRTESFTHMIDKLHILINYNANDN